MCLSKSDVPVLLMWSQPLLGSLLNASAKWSMMLVPADAGHRLRWLHPVVRLRCSTSSPEPDDPMEKYRAVFAQGRGVAWTRAFTFNARHGIELTTTPGGCSET